MLESGQYVRAGPDGTRRFARLLGLPAASRVRWRLDVDGVWPDHIRLGVGVGGTGFAFHIKAAGVGGAFMSTPHLRLAFEGTEIDAATERFLRRVARRLGRATFAELFRILLHDGLMDRDDPPSPEEKSPSDSSSGPDVAAPSRFTGPVGTQADCWRSFFLHHDLSHEVEEPLWADPQVVFLDYGDRECAHSHPEPDPRRWSFINDPAVPLPTSPHDRAHIEMTYLMSEIDEDDVVLGTGSALDRLLEAASAERDNAAIYIVNHLCTPVMIGDDLDGFARRCEDATDRPVLAITRDDKSDETTFERLFELLEAEVQRAPSTPPRRVNLLAFPAAFRRAELVPVIQRLGLEVCAELLPDVEIDAIRQLSSADVNIAPEPSRFGPLLTRLLDGGAAPTLAVPAPYGVEGTRAAYRAMADGLGRSDALEALWDEAWAPKRSRWARGVKEAQAYRLAFVVDDTDLGLLAEPARLGVPVLRVIKEMGFGVDFVHFDDEATASDSAAVDACRAAVSDARWHHFSNREALTSLLCEGAFHAVYSDLSMDWRLSRSGHSQFSVRHFEMGLDGALRTLENLLAACRTPFYARYARWLRGEQEGGR
jgi:hypothetical protein